MQRNFLFFFGSQKKLLAVVVGAVVLAALMARVGWILWRAWQVEIEHERVRTEASLEKQLVADKSDIGRLVPEYISRRDQLPDQPAPDQKRLYTAVRVRLVTLMSSYNEVAARLSLLQGRAAQLMIPAKVIPPRAPKMLPTRWAGGRLVVSWEVRKDDVTEEVDKNMTLLFERYGESFRNAFYLSLCRQGAGSVCTRLATLRIKSRLWHRVNVEDRELYERGCVLRDAAGCSSLGFDSFRQKHYMEAVQWLTKACALLDDGNGCGLLGTIYASKLLGEGRNPTEGRVALQRGCDMGAARSCYYLAFLLVSGQVERDLGQAWNWLEISCDKGLNEGCEALKRFTDFQFCESDALATFGGEDAVSLDISCKLPAQ